MSPNDRTEVIPSAERERVSRGDEVNDLSPERPPKTSKIGHLTADGDQTLYSDRQRVASDAGSGWFHPGVHRIGRRHAPRSPG
jgi:hypothetical protein